MLDPQRIHALRELERSYERCDYPAPDDHAVLQLLVAVDHVLRAFKGFNPTIEHDDKEAG